MASLPMMGGFAEFHLRQEGPICIRHHGGANAKHDESTFDVADIS